MQSFTHTALLTITVVLSIAVVLLVRRAPSQERRADRLVVTPAMIGGILRAAEPITVGGTAVRAMRVADAPAVGATIDDVVIHAMGWPRRTIARGYALWVASGRLAHYAVVVDPGSGAVLGVVGLEPVSEPSSGDAVGSVHIGMWAGPNGRGCGHMSRAVPRIADLLAGQRIALLAETAVDNVASRRVLERAGMSPIDRRTRRLPDGREVASVVYARSPSD